jgi:hypothetical protein
MTWNFINLNPTAPTIRDLIKIHKTGHPIQPIVNWTIAPAYTITATSEVGYTLDTRRRGGGARSLYGHVVALGKKTLV